MTVADLPRTTIEQLEVAKSPGSNGHEVNSKVPFHMTDDLHVPTERYYSREFFELEKKHLWPHVWQMACREEDIPDAGDYYEYEIVGQSVLVIRQRDMSIRAFHNACRHRGTQLGKGQGRFPGGQIVCPFHGWRWNLAGECTHVFGREGFSEDVLTTDDTTLEEVLCDTWGGHVWINMDRNAKPLLEELFPAANILDLVGVKNMRVKWWKEVVLNANWKLAQEAFFESYHVKQTHPQIYQFDQPDDDELNRSNTAFRQFVNGHGLFRGADVRTNYGGTAMNFLESARLLWSGMDAMTLERDIHIIESVAGKVDPNDPSFAGQAIDALFKFWEDANIPAPERSTDVLKMWGGDVVMFPNYLMLPQYTNSLNYRVRPYNDDPEWCTFEVWSLMTYPEGSETSRPEMLGTFDKDDADHWGLIPRQDFSNIERMQRGMQSQSMPLTRLSQSWEMTISNWHQELDRRIAAQL
jgi:phenylpropionate dioxygenase-like ring-hydroxylating dioxygenase large terminal subunit